MLATNSEVLKKWRIEVNHGCLAWIFLEENALIELEQLSIHNNSAAMLGNPATFRNQ